MFWYITVTLFHKKSHLMKDDFVPGMGLEPTRNKCTRPSTVPVYQFQHPGVIYVTIESHRNKKS